MRRVLRSREDAARLSIASIGGMRGAEAERAQTMLEAASALRAAYMAVNHMFLTAKRHRNYPLILPLQMALPSVMEEARALSDGVSAFKRGQPVGDGIGPLVLARMMRGLEKTEPAPQTAMAETEMDGRRVLLLKARGPGPTVGRLDEAVEAAFGGGVDAVVTVDAALRYEGQKSGRIEEGFGVAMGGSGAERFSVEEAAAKAGVPVLAVVVRQSVREAVTLMTRQIAESAEETGERVRQAVLRARGPARPSWWSGWATRRGWPNEGGHPRVHADAVRLVRRLGPQVLPRGRPDILRGRSVPLRKKDLRGAGVRRDARAMRS